VEDRNIGSHGVQRKQRKKGLGRKVKGLRTEEKATTLVSRRVRRGHKGKKD